MSDVVSISSANEKHPENNARSRTEVERTTGNLSNLRRQRLTLPTPEPPSPQSPSTTPKKAPRELPKDLTPQHQPLVKFVLSIPATIDRRIAEDEAREEQEYRDEENEELDDYVANVLYPFRVDEKEYWRKRRRIVMGEVMKTRARVWAGWAKKKRRKNVSLDDIRAFRLKMKRRLMENGRLNLDLQGPKAKKKAKKRIKKMDRKLVRIWKDYRRDCLNKVPRYIEGFPAKEALRMPHMWSGEFQPSGRKKCMQCRAKRMECGLTKIVFGQRLNKRKDTSLRACSRCVRSGDRWECCVSSNLLECGWQKAEMSLSEIEDAKNDEGKLEAFNEEAKAIFKKWLDVNYKVKADFFFTHLHNYNAITEKHKSRKLPKFNKDWFKQQRKLAAAARYRKNRDDGAIVEMWKQMELNQELAKQARMCFWVYEFPDVDVETF